MKKIAGLALLVSFLSVPLANAQLEGLSRKASELAKQNVDQAKNVTNKATAEEFMAQMKAKLKLTTAQTANIKPLAEQMVRDRTEVETTKLSNNAKAKKLKGIYEIFDGQLKGILTKIQWTKYLEWIKNFRK